MLPLRSCIAAAEVRRKTTPALAGMSARGNGVRRDSACLVCQSPVRERGARETMRSVRQTISVCAELVCYRSLGSRNRPACELTAAAPITLPRKETARCIEIFACTGHHRSQCRDWGGGLILLFTSFLAIPFSCQRLFDPALFARLEVEGMTFHFLDDVFLLHLAFEAAQRIFKRLAFLYANFRQRTTPPDRPSLGNHQSTANQPPNTSMHHTWSSRQEAPKTRVDSGFRANPHFLACRHPDQNTAYVERTFCRAISRLENCPLLTFN